MRRHPWILRLGLLGALIMPAIFFAGCGGSNGSSHTQLIATRLSSGEEVGVPAFHSTANGIFTMSINQEPTIAGIRGKTTFSVNLQTTGLDPNTVTSVDLGYGKAGTNGPFIFNLYTQGVGTLFANPLTLQMSSKNYAQPAGVPLTYDQALNAIASGNGYINISTYTHPQGEIRGQIGPVVLQATLDGTSSASSTTVLQLTGAQSAINVVLNAQGLPSDVTAVNIRLGVPGTSNGPIIFTFFANPSGGILSTPMTAQLTTSDFVVPPPGSGVGTFADAVDAILSGNTYITIETLEAPTGYIRGQILPTP